MIWLAPTGNSGVADYARVLRPHLPDLPALTVFHLGNNPLHAPIYRRLLTRQDPKRAVILHDAVLHHFLLGALSRDEYVAEFVYNYGEWTRALAQDLWDQRSRSGSAPEYFAHPMLRRAMEAAHLVIVHNAAAAHLAQAHGAPRVEILPHFIAPAPDFPAADLAQWRLRHGVAPPTVLLGVFGHLRESKRLPTILRAVAPQGPAVQLLVQGEWGSPALRDSLPLGSALRIGAVPEPELNLLIAATDLGVNLRYPSAGESSGILARLMAAGKPALVTQGDEHRHLPPGVVWPVPAGPEEDEALRLAIAYLAQHPVARREMGRAARHFAVTECSVQVLARRMAGLLQTV